jgi:hypothetical protein
MVLEVWMSAHAAEEFIADPWSEQGRTAIAKMVMRLFERWKLSTAEQLELLGLSPTSRNVLGRYRRGQPLPESRDAMDRAAYLLSIHKALRALYPENPEIVYGWVKMRNRQFDNFTPLEVMKKDGLLGLAKIDWHLSARLNH